MNYQWIPKKILFRVWNLWFPFLGSGIRILKVSSDFRQLEVGLKFCWWNRNYVGTQFGGSMFAMTDPFYMVMLIQNLGPEYIVWDSAATIKYLRPGRTEVSAVFQLLQSDLDHIKATTDLSGKMDWHAKVQIKDKNQNVVAEVEKIVYIRRKNF